MESIRDIGFVDSDRTVGAPRIILREIKDLSCQIISFGTNIIFHIPKLKKVQFH